MSGLGELLLGKIGENSPNTRETKGNNNNNNNISDNDKSNRNNRRSDEGSSLSPHKGGHDDGSYHSRSQRTFPSRVERNKQEDEEQSEASSTDDYVRELLDPNDRPRNVWHVVEGPKKSHDDYRSGRDHHQRIKRERDDDDRVSCTKIKQESDIDHNVKREYNDHDNDDVQQSINIKQEANLDISSDNQNLDVHRRVKLETGYKDVKPDINRMPDQDDSRTVEDTSRERSSSRHGSSRYHDNDRHTSRERDDRGYRSSSRKHRSHRKNDHSDDDNDNDHYNNRHRKSGTRRGQRRSHSRSRSRSPISSSSRRRDTSRSSSPHRNSRTVIVMQLSQRVVTRDLEDYFNDNIGHVREVKLIMDSRTKRHKGVAYIEFSDSRSASKALTLNGRKLHGVPLAIQAVNSKSGDHLASSQHHSSSSRTNYQKSTTTSTYPSSRSLPPNAYRVYIGALHTGITDEMLKTIVEPFGPVLKVEIIKDRTTGVSRGYAFITYANAEDGQEAVKCLDGFELAGKCMRVSKSTEKGEH